MISTSTPPAPIAPRRRALRRREAMRLARIEYRRAVRTVEALSHEDWSKPTECTAWDVRQMVGHVIGMAAMAAGPREASRQQREAQREHAVRGGVMIDSLTAVQVRERDGRSPQELVAEARRVAPRAARGRRLTLASSGDAPSP